MSAEEALPNDLPSNKTWGKIPVELLGKIAEHAAECGQFSTVASLARTNRDAHRFLLSTLHRKVMLYNEDTWKWLSPEGVNDIKSFEDARRERADLAEHVTITCVPSSKTYQAIMYSLKSQPLFSRAKKLTISPTVFDTLYESYKSMSKEDKRQFSASLVPPIFDVYDYTRLIHRLIKPSHLSIIGRHSYSTGYIMGDFNDVIDMKYFVQSLDLEECVWHSATHEMLIKIAGPKVRSEAHFAPHIHSTAESDQDDFLNGRTHQIYGCYIHPGAHFTVVGPGLRCDDTLKNREEGETDIQQEIFEEVKHRALGLARTRAYLPQAPQNTMDTRIDFKSSAECDCSCYDWYNRPPDSESITGQP